MPIKPIFIPAWHELDRRQGSRDVDHAVFRGHEAAFGIAEHQAHDVAARLDVEAGVYGEAVAGRSEQGGDNHQVVEVAVLNLSELEATQVQPCQDGDAGAAAGGPGGLDVELDGQSEERRVG